jgi:hypothetical protein
LQYYAGALRRRRPRPGEKWHLDEAFIKVDGELKYLWRAVDQEGMVLDILVPVRRDTAAARRLLRRLLKKTPTVPRVVVTDKPRSHGAAHREVMPLVEHRCHKGLNNRAENSHRPTRQRERAMKDLAIGRRRAAVPGRVQRHLTPLPAPPPPDDRPRLPSRDDHPVRHHREVGGRTDRTGHRNAVSEEPKHNHPPSTKRDTGAFLMTYQPGERNRCTLRRRT